MQSLHPEALSTAVPFDQDAEENRDQEAPIFGSVEDDRIVAGLLVLSVLAFLWMALLSDIPAQQAFGWAVLVLSGFVSLGRHIYVALQELWQ